MRKLQIADADMLRITLQQEIQRSEESRYNHKLHGILLVAAGHDCQQVADLFSQDRRTVQRWVRTFEHHGLGGLREGERPGRPRSLNSQQWKSLEKDLQKSPETFGFLRSLWDGKTLSEHLLRRYEAALGVRQCQRLFKLMGFRYRQPRRTVAPSSPDLFGPMEKIHKLAKTGGC